MIIISIRHLINGLFNTDYPENSTVDYQWTEFENNKLKKTLADTIVIVNKKYSYHMEAQMKEDEEIVFRVFDYSYAHAERNRMIKQDTYILPFPEPVIIYLNEASHTPDEVSLRLDFGKQGSFTYHVKTFKYQEISLEELNRKKLIILIPFQLLKVRKLMRKERSEKNLNLLKKIIFDDIIGSIGINVKAGNITEYDADRLRRMTKALYDYLYSHYEETEELSMLTDESIIFEIDLIEQRHEKELAEANAKLEEANAKMEESNAKIEQEKIEKEQIKSITKLALNGKTISEISQELHIPEEQVKEMLE